MLKRVLRLDARRGRPTLTAEALFGAMNAMSHTIATSVRSSSDDNTRVTELSGMLSCHQFMRSGRADVIIGRERTDQGLWYAWRPYLLHEQPQGVGVRCGNCHHVGHSVRRCERVFLVPAAQEASLIAAAGVDKLQDHPLYVRYADEFKTMLNLRTPSTRALNTEQLRERRRQIAEFENAVDCQVCGDIWTEEKALGDMKDWRMCDTCNFGVCNRGTCTVQHDIFTDHVRQCDIPTANK